MSSVSSDSETSGVPIREVGDRAIYAKYHYTCVYCGFDGRTFDGWMQLTIDHVRPRHQAVNHAPDNLVVACGSCNSITSRMKFDEGESREAIIKKKQDKVRERREGFYKEWLANVAPKFLERPLIPVSAFERPVEDAGQTENSVAMNPSVAGSKRALD